MTKAWTAEIVGVKLLTGEIQFYWFVRTGLTGNFSPQLLHREGLLHGPFKTEAEAEENLRLVPGGPDLKVTEGGIWNSSWDKLQ